MLCWPHRPVVEPRRFNPHPAPARSPERQACRRQTSRWSCGWIHLQLFMLLVLLNNTNSSTQACCADEQAPITNCSFTSRQGHVLCNIIEVSSATGDCIHSDWTTTNEEMPAPILEESVGISFFNTKCTPTIDSDLNVGPCLTTCTDRVGKFYTGVNITFKVHPFTADKLESIQVALYGLSNFHDGFLWCRLFQIGRGHLAMSSAEEHLFYYDGFIGLEPGALYDVIIKTLPTTSQVKNEYSVEVEVPYDSCEPATPSDCMCEIDVSGWKAVVKVHNSTFALNFTLLLDYPDYNFDTYDIVMYSRNHFDITRYKEINVNGVETYLFDGRNATVISVECLIPDEYVIQITPYDCNYCHPSEMTLQVHAGAPEILDCPANITKFVELGDALPLIDWKEPTFKSLCENSSGLDPVRVRQSHHPLQNSFEIGLTEVTYQFTHYDAIAECSFFVNIMTVDTLPPKVISCPQDKLLKVEAGQDAVTVTWNEPQVVDLSSPITVRSFPPNGSDFPAGVNTTVLYSFTDAAGNTDERSCSFVVSVIVEDSISASPIAVIVGSLMGLFLVLLVAALLLYKRVPSVREYIISWREKLIRKKEKNVLQMEIAPECRNNAVRLLPLDGQEYHISLSALEKAKSTSTLETLPTHFSEESLTPHPELRHPSHPSRVDSSRMNFGRSLSQPDMKVLNLDQHLSAGYPPRSIHDKERHRDGIMDEDEACREPLLYRPQLSEPNERSKACLRHLKGAASPHSYYIRVPVHRESAVSTEHSDSAKLTCDGDKNPQRTSGELTSMDYIPTDRGLFQRDDDLKESCLKEMNWPQTSLESYTDNC